MLVKMSELDISIEELLNKIDTLPPKNEPTLYEGMEVDLDDLLQKIDEIMKD